MITMGGSQLSVPGTGKDTDTKTCMVKPQQDKLKQKKTKKKYRTGKEGPKLNCSGKKEQAELGNIDRDSERGICLRGE